ncbi:MAG: competence/damage-inducible protein A [Bacteroidales bacterium]|nr:competence/damage-inducible protein A [Bacteroidales bacterium]MDD4671899.1 competence/damage-inducible protein A [Bacteroidales bacterium]MDY0348677.1 competence/damage-inducible protein A [Tenuifilaceae bacterium]
MNAALLTIGDEILIGQIVDTSSAWMAEELNKIGVNVCQIVSISDTNDDIKKSVGELLSKYDVVLATGGLGPTSDDITKPALCEFFGTNMVVHEPTLKHVEGIFTKRGLPLTELNAKQAEVPASCEVIHNPTGTAPGMWFNKEGKIFVSMPGVPFEMKAIMGSNIIPRLSKLTATQQILHKTIQTFGLPESFLAQQLSEWEENLPSHIKLAYLPGPNAIRLRLSTRGNNINLLKQEVHHQIDALTKIIPNNIFGFDDDSMVSVVSSLLKQNNATLAVAESCTGGSIAHMITLQPGSSTFFLGGVVAYSNAAKSSLLGVDKKLIDAHGAVSQPVVEAMAQGAREKFNANYSIATSGIAGPTGATENKPVGTIWIAVSTPQKTISQLLSYGDNRNRNILRSSVAALNLLRFILINPNYSFE